MSTTTENCPECGGEGHTVDYEGRRIKCGTCDTVTITVPGPPLAQPRQRTTVRNGFAANYTPSRAPVNAYKAAIQLAYQAQSQTVLQGPVELTILFVFPRPKAKCWKTKPTPRYHHTIKPDADNCVKAVKDSLNQIAWRDDSQVCSLRVTKVVASGDEQPHTVIEVREP